MIWYLWYAIYIIVHSVCDYRLSFANYMQYTDFKCGDIEHYFGVAIQNMFMMTTCYSKNTVK